jgi:hypothetical protein
MPIGTTGRFGPPGFVGPPGKPRPLVSAVASAYALVETFKEHFNAPLDTAVWTPHVDRVGDTVQFVNGVADLAVNGTTTFSQVDVRTKYGFSLIGSSAFVKLVRPARMAGDVTGITTQFMLVIGGTTTNDRVRWEIDSDGHMYAVYTIDEAAHDIATVVANYWASPQTYTWLRMRESGGTLYWDSAPDTASNPPVEADWVNRFSCPVDATARPEYVTPTLLLSYSSPASAPIQSAQFDGLNTSAFPPMETLVENFDAAMDIAKWTEFENLGGTATFTGGVLELLPTATTNSEARIISVDSYDLRGSEHVVKMVQPVLATSWGVSTGFRVFDEPSGGASYLDAFVNSDGGFIVSKTTQGVPFDPSQNTDLGTWSSASHSWFRFRESLGIAYFDTAPDTASNPPIEADWVNRVIITDPPSNLASCRAYIYVYTGNGTQAGTINQPAQFDGLNTNVNVGSSDCTVATSQAQSASASSTVSSSASAATSQAQSVSAAASVRTIATASTSQGQSASAAASVGVTATATTSQAQSASASAAVITSATAATSQAQSVAATASVYWNVTAATSQAQSASASAAISITASATTSQAQSVSAAASVGVSVAATTSEAQSASASASVSISTSAATSQAQSASASGSVGASVASSISQAQSVGAAASVGVVVSVASAQAQSATGAAGFENVVAGATSQAQGSSAAAGVSVDATVSTQQAQGTGNAGPSVQEAIVASFALFSAVGGSSAVREAVVLREVFMVQAVGGHAKINEAVGMQPAVMAAVSGATEARPA